VNFMKWPGYHQFFRQVALWLASTVAEEEASAPAPAAEGAAAPPPAAAPRIRPALKKVKTRKRQVKQR